MSVQIKTEEGWKKVAGNSRGGGSGTSDYSELTNKPQINNIELSSNKSLADLGIQSEINSGNLLPFDLVQGDHGMTAYEQFIDLDNKVTTLQETVGQANALLEEV